MGSMLPPIGFWSYSRQDDDARGRLSGLRSVVQSLLQMQYGRDQVQIFQDVAAIPPGADWEEKIKAALNDSTFLIPIITPGYIQSRWCTEEFEIFREQEIALNRKFPSLKNQRRIFPLYYVDITGIEPYQQSLVDELKRLQWLDFRRLIFEDVSARTVQEPLARFSGSIRNLLLTKAAEGVSAEAAPVAPESQDAAKTIRPPQPRRRRKPLVLGLAVLALAVCVVLYVALTSGGKPAPPPAAQPAAAAPAPTPVDRAVQTAQSFVGNWAPTGLDCDSAVKISVANSTLTLASPGGALSGTIRPSSSDGAIDVQSANGVFSYHLDGDTLVRLSSQGGRTEMTRCAS